MPIEIVPYDADHIGSVRAFNARLRAGGVPFGFPETNVPTWLPPVTGSSLYQEYFLAVDDGAVRGGYVLKHQDFVLAGHVASIGFLEHPLSEGTFDKRYGLVASQLLRHALRRQQRLYALGIGGYEEAVGRLLQRARFSIVTVPFHFRVEHAARFLREVRALRTSPLRRFACDVGASTGLGALGIAVVQRYHGHPRSSPHVASESFLSFGDAADALWGATLGTYSLGAVRDRRVLARLYDGLGNPFLRVAVTFDGEPYGWAVCLATEVGNHKYFGDLKLGSIVDCLVRPGFERDLIGAVVERLRQEDVDLIVTNQSLQGMREALSGAGFLSGPSNFLFAASPKLAEGYLPLESHLGTFHLTRGDGDGPINL